MEKRRLIKSGEGSFVASLPIDWVRRGKLKKGDAVFVLDRGEDVLIYAEPKKVKTIREGIIDCKDKDFFEAKNKIISYYLNNVSTIIIKNIDDYGRGKIIEFISFLPGYEIAVEEKDKIEINDVLDEDKIDFNQSLKRIDMMVRTSFDYLQSILKSKDEIPVLTKGRIQGNCFFLMRILKNVLENSSLSVKYDITLSSIISYNKLISSLENINDHLEKTSQIISDCNQNIKSNNFEKVSLMIISLKTGYESAINSFYKKDLKIVEKILREKEKNKKTIATLLLNKSQKETSLFLYNELIEIEKSIRAISLLTYDYATSIEITVKK